jgi:hypothetical protein
VCVCVGVRCCSYTLKRNPGGAKSKSKSQRQHHANSPPALQYARGEVEITFQLTAPTSWARCPRLRTNNRYPGGPVASTTGKAGGKGLGWVWCERLELELELLTANC